VNRAKAFSRRSIERCQRRVCTPAAAEILGREPGLALEAVGRLRGRPPVKPAPMAITVK
jgi:hypothetical protein